LTGIAVLAAGSALFWWLTSRHDASGTARAFTGGAELAGQSTGRKTAVIGAGSACYTYSLRSDIEINPAPMGSPSDETFDPQRVRLVVSGTMNRRDLGEDDVQGIRYVGYQLSDVTVVINGVTNQGLSALYGRLGMAVCGPAGHMLSFCLPAALSAKDQACLKGLFYPMQITSPQIAEPGSSDEQWLTEETDAAGTYQARYTRLSAEELFKEKLQYTSLNQENVAGVSARITDSAWQITADSHLVPEVILGSERVEFYMGDTLFSRSDTVIDIRRTGQTNAASASIWALTGNPSNLCMEIFAQGVGEPVGDDVWEQQRLEALREKYAGIPVRDVYDALEYAVMQRQSHADTIPAIHALRDYLLVNPDKALDLPAMIKEQQADDQLAGRIILAIELAGTPQAQAALLTITQDPEQRMNQRIQSVVACGGIKTPKEDFAETLWNISDDNAADPRLRDTALLSLGALGADGDPHQAETIRAGLIERLSSAGDLRQQELALLALDNCGGLPGQELQPYITSDDPVLRAAAVQHYRHQTNDASITAVSSLLLNDSAPSVRQAAFGVLEPCSEPQVQQLVRDGLSAETDRSLRRSMIRYLGRYNHVDENRELLIRMAQTTDDFDLRKDLWRAVYFVPPRTD
jgi:hypothetical protein